MKILLQSLLSLFLLSSSVLAQDQRPLVKIGVILPLTGGLADAGTAFRDAAMLARDSISHASSCRYELLFEDDQLASSKVASAAKKLIDVDHVDSVISTWSYGGTVVAPMAEKAHIPHFATAWDTAITKGRKFSFLHLSPPRTFAPMFIDILKKRGVSKIGLVGFNESGSIYALDEFVKVAEKNNIKIVFRDSFDYSQTDFRSELVKIKGSGVDYLFVNLAMPHIQVLLKQMKDLNVQVPITTMTGFEVLEDISLAEGAWYVSDSTPPEEFSDELMKRYHQKRTYGVGNYYDLVHLIVNRYEEKCKTHKPSGVEIIESLNDLSGFRSLFGTLELGNDHVFSYPSVYRMIKNGKRITVPKESL